MAEKKPTRRKVKSTLNRTRDWFRAHVPPGLRIVLGVLLMVGGVFGFLPILGFWMFPLGVVIASLDIEPLYAWLRNGNGGQGPDGR